MTTWHPLRDEEVGKALVEMRDVFARLRCRWALIGGQALVAHGVPRSTTDLDVMLHVDRLLAVAGQLAHTGGWCPATRRADGRCYVLAPAVEVLEWADPVLAEVDLRPKMVPLLTSAAVVVKLFAAQHSVERDALRTSVFRTCCGIEIPVAPLGGVLLMKAMLGRTVDLAAIEQVAESVPIGELRRAIAWTERRDPQRGARMRTFMEAVKRRSAPVRLTPVRRD